MTGGEKKKIQEENRRLKRELRQRTRELSFFINVGKALTSTLEFRKVLKIIMEKAQRLIRCESWAILLLSDTQQELSFELVKGPWLKEVRDIRIKVGEGLEGQVAQSGVPLIISNLEREQPLKRQPLLRRLKAKSVLCVPIVSKKKTLGVLEMVNKLNGAPFGKTDVDLLLKLVDHAAIALERSFLYQQMSDLAIMDDLTRLYNFRHLDRVLENEIRRGQRYGSTVSLVFLDMDHFKHVNDRHGHLNGSKVLVEMAQLLLRNLREVDIVARYGGDEFVVVLPQTSVPIARKIVERIQESLRKNEFLKEDGLRLKLSASFGIAGFPEHAKNKTDLIRLADQAMYRAKETGRDRLCIA
jgi:diguanylate cyclase (GGDEF)-like protein